MVLDELPVMGHPDSEDYVRAIREYVTSMKELIPNHPSHPTDDWLNRGFAMISLDGNQEAASTPKQGTPIAGGMKAGGSPPSRKSTTRRNVAAATTGVANLRLKSKTAHLNQQLKDRPFRVHAVSNKAA